MHHVKVGGRSTWPCRCTAYVAPVLRPAVERTRTTDPETSLAAAASISEHNLRVSQQAVLRYLRGRGPVTDVGLVDGYEAASAANPARFPRQSVSGLRTRRAELVAAGLVKDTGRREALPSNRLAIVWEAVGGQGLQP